MQLKYFGTFLLIVLQFCSYSQKRPRELGIKIGVLSPGKFNSITDVIGVKVGHFTLETSEVHTGVTVIIPHEGNIFQSKVPAAVFIGNGFGKLVGTTQIKELGNLETPIALTNTLSVSAAMEALIEYTLKLPGNENVQSVNAVVGETNDGTLNDIRGMHVKKVHLQEAISKAKSGEVQEGNTGAGTGTVCFGFKGGIGTSSRILPSVAGGYTVGVLVQSNFGGVLQIDGVPIGEELRKFYMSEYIKDKGDGSCMIIVATDAPIDSRNLERLASRAMLGLAKTGGIASNGSGDYVIAFSTNDKLRIPHTSNSRTQSVELLNNDEMSPLFMAVIEATEEAIINSLFMAKTLKGKNGTVINSLPVDEVIQIMKKYNAIK
jgi:D-aminopeptidase